MLRCWTLRNVRPCSLLSMLPDTRVPTTDETLLCADTASVPYSRHRRVPTASSFRVCGQTQAMTTAASEGKRPATRWRALAWLHVAALLQNINGACRVGSW